MDAGARVLSVVEHLELHLAFAGHAAVEGRGDVADVIPLGGNVPGGSDEHGDDPDHSDLRIHYSMNVGRLWEATASSAAPDWKRICAAFGIEKKIADERVCCI
jgi:hypothetical protein